MSSAAIRKSQASASSRPTPKTYPWSRAITGFEQRSGAATFFASCETTQGDFVRKPAMSPPAVNWPPAPVSTTNRTDVVAVELGEERRELVAREHRDPVELPGHVQRDRRHAAVGVVLDPESVVLGHTLSFVSSRRILRRIFPDGLFGSAATRRYSRGRLKRARGEARQCASSSSGVAVADDDRDDPLARAGRRALRRPPPRARRGGSRGRPRPRAGWMFSPPEMIMSSTPPVDPEVAVVVEVPGVARVVPAVADRLRVGVGPVPVAAERLVAREVDADLAVRLEPQAGVHRGPPGTPGLRDLVAADRERVDLGRAVVVDEHVGREDLDAARHERRGHRRARVAERANAREVVLVEPRRR